ncbi:HNH endonuclease signature motif containing protein [Mycolicibacterium houstonense]|uniref:HNH endonuclease signature motif containing protein n=1 Tax=Mycolicibacterium houstonense TaxID=146021 RepID=UPI00093B9474
MPRAPRVCAHPTCTTLTPTRHCPTHTTKHRWGKGNPRTKDPRHEAWRKVVLDRAGWWCQIRYQGCTGRANQADHILAVGLGGTEYDAANGQAVCKECHKKKSADEGHIAQGHQVRSRRAN